MLATKSRRLPPHLEQLEAGHVDAGPVVDSDVRRVQRDVPGIAVH